MLATLISISLLAAPDVAPVEFRPGQSIQLDGKLDQAEWADAFLVPGGLTPDSPYRVFIKRVGGYVALGVASSAPYRGEMLSIVTGDPFGSWMTHVVLGLGNPAHPPMLARRASPAGLNQARAMAGMNPPRACRARVRMDHADHWSAEYLIRLSAFGIGRGDARQFRFRLLLDVVRPKPKLVFGYPAAGGLFDVKATAPLATPDQFGAKERWASPSAAESLEYDDNELLFRLFREHFRMISSSEPEALVISSAVRPRVNAKIHKLRSALDAGRKRNPLLPAWHYYLGRLLTEANLFEEARSYVDSIPDSLRDTYPYANLAADHFIATEEWQLGLDVCMRNKGAADFLDKTKLLLNLRRFATAEKEAIAKDAKKLEPNPRVKFITAKGEFIVELFEDDAPHAVNNFLALVNVKYYDRLRFHLVMGSNIAAVGDPRTRPGSADRHDGPAWRVKPDPGRRAPLRGYLTAIPQRGGVFHGSQFWILTTPLLKEARAVAPFGRIIEGLSVLDALEQDDTLLKIEVIRKRNHEYTGLEARLTR